MRYFDTTPLGSLVQRFSSDLDQARTYTHGVCCPPFGTTLRQQQTFAGLHQPPHLTLPSLPSHTRPQQVDQQLPGTLGMFITCVLQILGAMAAVLAATPAFSLAILPLSWVRASVCVRVSARAC